MLYNRVSGVVQVTLAFVCGGLVEKFQIFMQIVAIEGAFGLRRDSVFAR